VAGLFLTGDTCLKILGMAFTAKQEAFIAAAIKGMNDSDAYRAAYDCSRMKPETVNRKAHELMRNGKIRARIEAARAEAAKQAQWSLDMAVERTKAVNDVAFEDITKYGICEKRPTTKAFIDSASMLNRLTGVDRQITKSEEQSDSRPECPPFDLSANISPTFCSVSRAIDGGKADRVVLKGGRGSSKSSYAYQKALDVFLKRPHAQADHGSAEVPIPRSNPEANRWSSLDSRRVPYLAQDRSRQRN
jgi:phage terminase small subunit